MHLETSGDIHALLYKLARRDRIQMYIQPGDFDWSDFEADDYDDKQKEVNQFYT